MINPNFCEEKKLCKSGFKSIAGVDEAGRGPLAGPVVAAAVIFSVQGVRLSAKQGTTSPWKRIKDSKKLTEKQREELFKIITNHPEIKWGVGVVSEKIIDKINILEATKLAMQKAVKNLNPDFILIDGNFTVSKIKIPQKAIIKGDLKVFSIAAASIIAKVTRDKLMQKYHKKYPHYGFDSHKGYPTKAHFLKLKELGPCLIHRKTFWPVSSFNG